MSKTKLLTIGLISLLVLNLGLISFLFINRPMPGPGGRGLRNDGPPKPREMVIERLHFSPAQIGEYDKLIEQHQKGIRNANDRIALVKNELYRSLSNTDLAVRDSLIVKLGELQQQIELIHYNHFADIRKICEPEQIASFDRLTKDLAKFFFNQQKIGPPGRRN